MCSYKLVTVKFEVWGLQTRVEQFVHKVKSHFLFNLDLAFNWFTTIKHEQFRMKNPTDTLKSVMLLIYSKYL